MPWVALIATACTLIGIVCTLTSGAGRPPGDTEPGFWTIAGRLSLAPNQWEHGCMLFDGVSRQLYDIDAGETAEWMDAFDDVVKTHGRTRARYLLMRLLEQARAKNVDFPASVSTPYVNTIPTDREPEFPGDEHIERRIRAYIPVSYTHLRAHETGRNLVC